MTYYLKYRPQTLAELDSLAVKDSLEKIMSSGNIPHAFLFAGPKGTGKTSAARIIAKILNCEKIKKAGVPCNRCNQCTSITKGSNIDVIEIDAASNRGIDDIRVLRESVKLASVGGRKKIYIIDEVHMLTLEASNALLKTLEEPPDHVLFILATTNPEKLIKTIRSRVTEIVFKKALPEEISLSLGKIVKAEKLKLDKEVIDLIAGNSDGSFRDAAKLLEQAVAEGIKDRAKVEAWITGKSGGTALKVIDLLKVGDERKIIGLIENGLDGGMSVKTLIEDLLREIKDSVLAKAGVGKDNIPEISGDDLFYLVDLLLKAEEQTGISAVESLPLEIAVIKWCEERKPKETKAVKDQNVTEEENEEEEVESNPLPLEDWKKILASVRPINTSIEALLRAARPMCFDGRTLTLSVFYRFHKERLEEDKHRRLLEDIISKVLATQTRVVCSLAEPPEKTETAVDISRNVVLEEPKAVLEPPKEVLTKGGSNDIIEVAKKLFSN